MSLKCIKKVCVLVAMQAEAPLGSKLHAVASTGALNLQLVTAATLGASFLPLVLPRAWEGQASVPWDPEAAPGEGAGIGAAALRELWTVLADLPDLAPLAPWPLLPVHTRRLCQLSATSSARLPMLRGGLGCQQHVQVPWHRARMPAYVNLAASDAMSGYCVKAHQCMTAVC